MFGCSFAACHSSWQDDRALSLFVARKTCSQPHGSTAVAVAGADGVIHNVVNRVKHVTDAIFCLHLNPAAFCLLAGS